MRPDTATETIMMGMRCVILKHYYLRNNFLVYELKYEISREILALFPLDLLISTFGRILRVHAVLVTLTTSFRLKTSLYIFY